MKVLHTGLAAAAVIAIGASAQADPTVFTIESFATNGTQIEDFSIAAYVFGTTDWIDFSDDNMPAFNNIEVNSGPSQRPGFDYELSLNYEDYDIGFFANGTHTVDLVNIKSDGSITDVFVKDSIGNPIGNWSTDGNSINWSATVSQILAVIGPDENLPITIQWAQFIPAPGALALMGLAGLAGGRRRRR